MPSLRNLKLLVHLKCFQNKAQPLATAANALVVWLDLPIFACSFLLPWPCTLSTGQLAFLLHTMLYKPLHRLPIRPGLVTLCYSFDRSQSCHLLSESLLDKTLVDFSLLLLVKSSMLLLIIVLIN